MKLIVGLGNPDQKYALNRHNVGFMILDAFAEHNNITFKRNGNSLIAVVPDKKIILLKPQLYMNKSGIEVNRVANYYDIRNEDIMVIHDDKDIEFGYDKLKFNSSSGGHNGIKNIIEYRGADFLRLKIGIKNRDIKNTVDFVLSDFNKDERGFLQNTFTRYFEIIEDFRNSNYLELMNKYNGDLK